MQPNEWLTATLSVLTIALTILGVLIALGSLWGYREIKQQAIAIAEKAAKEQMATFLDTQEIRDKLKSEVKLRVAQEADTLFNDLSLGQAYGDGLPMHGSVGEEYPKDGQE